MNNNGFTLIELIASMAILTIISVIGMFSFKGVLDNTSDKYYRMLESHLLLASNNYFQDIRPDSINGKSSVSIEHLVRRNYIGELKDKNGNICDDGEVIRYLDENHHYQYKICLKCDNYISPSCE